ncbi:MAG: glycosyltransferase family 4 protein [Chloroflexota bacterium]
MNIIHMGGVLPVMHAYGGAVERRILEIAKEQARQGHRVIVYSIGDAAGTIKVDGVEIRHIPCISDLPWVQFEFPLRALAGLRKEPQVEVIHFHGQPLGALVGQALPGKKLLSYDYFYYGGRLKTLLYPLYKHALTRFDLLMPCSRYCLQESVTYWRFSTQKMHVLYNGVNTHQFRPDAGSGAAERKMLGIDKRVVLYVGRVCRQKGSDVLIEAIRLLNERRNDIQLVVAGPIALFGHTPQSDPWIDRIKQVGGLYLGAVEESRLAAIYNLADVFVMPTRSIEMFGMAAVEAQACGKPVVASDHGGLKETVPQACGARFPVGDSEKLAEKIELLLDDPPRYAACAANAIQHADRYEWSRICARLDELYRLAHYGVANKPIIRSNDFSHF